MNKYAIGAALALVTAMPAAAQTGPIVAQPATATAGGIIVVHPAGELTADSSLPANTDIWLSLDQPLTSKHHKEGDTFPMTVSRDVMLGNYVVIPRGTPGHGRIAYRTGKGAFGKSAKMEFDVTDVQLAGRMINVGGHYRLEGNGNTGATVAAAATVWVASPFITGHSATAAQGTEYKASTKEPLMVALAPAMPGSPTVAPVAAPVAPAQPALTPAVATRAK